MSRTATLPRNAATAARVDFNPASLNFGAVSPQSNGPDISVDPSFGPPAISFAGALRIPNVPTVTTVSASIRTGAPNFKVRDLIAMDWVWEEVDPGELPPGHHGPAPKVRVLEVSRQSDGSMPLAVTPGQYVLVRVEYLAPDAGSNFAGTLAVSGDGWEPIEIPLSFFLSGVETTVANTPVKLAQGTTTNVDVAIQVVAGPDSTVRFEISPTQLHSGISIVGANEFHATTRSQTVGLKLRTDLDAPLGDNTLAINRFFNNTRSGFFVPVTVKPFSSIQKIRGLSVVPEPTAATFTFTTDKVSKPVITIWRRSINHDPVKEMVPANQITVSLGGPAPQTSHSIRVAGLPVGQALWFRIDAGVEDPNLPASAFDTRTGETGTLQRTCFMKVWSIDVLQAGGDDSGPEDGNEIDFGFVVFDNARGAKLSEENFAKFDSVDHGQVLTPIIGDQDHFIAVPGSTDEIVPFIRGVSQDPDFPPLPGPAHYWTMPETLPAKPDSGANGDGSWADAFGTFSPPATMGETTSSTMVISTGLTLLSYLAKITFRTVVEDPLGVMGMQFPDSP